MTSLTIAAIAAGCSDDDPAIVACEGQCTCDSDTRTCECMGGTTCVMEGGTDVTFRCNGNASCDFLCGANCTSECPGTSVCVAAMGEGSMARCNGTGRCDVTCSGDCRVVCTGNEECTLSCPEGADCAITECSQVIECEGQNAFACRTDCPPAA